MVTKPKLDRRQRARSEETLQEAIDSKIEKDALPKGVKETLLTKLKMIFLSYCSDSTDNIVTIPAMDAAELALKLIHLWSEEDNSGKAAGAANIRSWRSCKPFVPR